ncbi:MAG: hypothetical protein Q6365_007015 [Candidatus Sigynarchaeota archaeon]
MFSHYAKTKNRKRGNLSRYLVSLLFLATIAGSLAFFAIKPAMVEPNTCLTRIEPKTCSIENSQGSSDDPVLEGGGYNTGTVARFNVVENVTSLIAKRDFQAIPSNLHTIATPAGWQINDTRLENIQPYYKLQKIVDPTFSQPGGASWNPTMRATGPGTLGMAFYPLPMMPQYTQTFIKHLAFSQNTPGFRAGDYALWNQVAPVMNTNGHEVAEGLLYQAQSQDIKDFGGFLTNPAFLADLNAPYGGVNRPDDEITLVYEGSTKSLLVNMMPATTVLGGNPSAAWWNLTNIPYEADYVQLKLSWSIDSASSFEAPDNYQVCARVNDQYIDGRPVASGGMMIARTDALPYTGSPTNLIAYTNPLHLSHPRITRTYNITSLVNGLAGLNKIDFGVWCANPTWNGDQDRIIARFHYAEISYNTTNKFEVARLEFDYSATSNLTFNIGTIPQAFIAANRMSLFLKLEQLDTGDSREIRVLPYKSMIVTRAGGPSPSWNHVAFSISQKYKSLLQQNNLKISLGLIFEKDFYEPMSHTILLDNVMFTINYKYTDVPSAQLDVSIDGGGWIPITTASYEVNAGSWIPGQDHAFAFRSRHPEYATATFINFDTRFVAYQFRLVPSGAAATYAIPSANNPNGTWTITYDNTATFNALVVLNATKRFNISIYSFSCLDLPAFDNKGSQSGNWLITSASTPVGTDFTSNMVRFNFSADASVQSVRLRQPLFAGIWTIRATQPNYITGLIFLNSVPYLGIPAYYRGQTLNFTFTIRESLPASAYRLALLDSGGNMLAGYPVHRSSSGQVISGSTPLLTSYAVGKYYIELRWNDSVAIPGTTRRFGSLRDDFYILNATTASFVSTTSSVQSGITANFTIRYRTSDSFPITGANITVFDNSSGIPELYGMSWRGSYQAGFSDLGNGDYQIPLYTTGAPGGLYKLIFNITKLNHQPQNLLWNLTITTTSSINASILIGATKVGGKYVIDPGNIPYVNDTINSRIQVFLKDLASGNPLLNGLVIGRVGTAGKISQAVEIYKITNLSADRGKYNLTLDTTGLNATAPGTNTTLFITCSASGYNPVMIHVNMTIAKCPTMTTLNSIPPVNEGGNVLLVAAFATRVNPAAPIPYNYGTLTYFIYQGSTQLRTGTLQFLMSGVYSRTVSIDGLVPGNYTVRVNATAFNCQSSLSTNVSLSIRPRLTTDIMLELPDSIRILKPFQIVATLTYLVNGTGIPGKTLMLNIVIGTVLNFTVTGTTDSQGKVIYDYIIDPRYLNELFKVTAIFAGDTDLAPDTSLADRTVLDRVPINMAIIESPTTVRTGYSATYGLQINITDPSESLLNRLIMFVAWYENQNMAPFLTQQLRTDINGIVRYTIPEIAGGFANLTIIFEYQGSSTVAYNYTALVQPILPRWTFSFTLASLPGIIRYGQTITFSLNFTCENATYPLMGLPVIFTFLYGINPSSTVYIQQGNTAMLVYTIPESVGATLNVSISFPGTAQVEGYTQLVSLSISPKIQVVLQFASAISPSYMTGKYIFSIRATDGGGTPLEGLDIVFDVSGQQQVARTNTDGIASITIELTEVGNEIVLHVRFIEAGEYAGAMLDSPRFRVLNEWLYFLDLLPYIGIALAIVMAIAISIHRGVVVPRRNRARAQLRRMYNRLSDVENIQYVLVIHKAGGVPMFSKSLAEVPIDESLVSGFLSAISSFGAEISTKMKKDLKGGLEELSYQQFKIILDEGQHVRVALLLLRRPSDTLKERLRAFTIEFEKYFQTQVVNFKGEVLQDMAVTPVIERVFESDLLYPHRLIEQKVIPYAKQLPRKSIAKKVLTVARGAEFESMFYIRELINNLKTKGIEEIHSFDAIQKLKTDQIVFAINPRTNYIIDQLKPYIKMLTADDRNTLFAIYDHNTDGMAIQKYFNKNKIVLTTELAEVLAKLKSMRIIEENNHINSTGAAIVTLLQLIPDL